MWVDGKQHGAMGWWREDGSKQWEETWVNGKKHGLETHWYEKSGLKRSEEYFVNNALYARIEWDEKGTMAKVKFPPRAPTTTTTTTTTTTNLNPKTISPTGKSKYHTKG